MNDRIPELASELAFEITKELKSDIKKFFPLTSSLNVATISHNETAKIYNIMK